jgi:hypothetical protein
MAITLSPNTQRNLERLRDVCFGTESEPADRLQDETGRSTGQEEHRDQQGVRTVWTEAVRDTHAHNGKALCITGRPGTNTAVMCSCKKWPICLIACFISQTTGRISIKFVNSSFFRVIKSNSIYRSKKR